MPIYVFACSAGHSWEDILPLDAPTPPCPECGAEGKRVPATFRADLRGKGWTGKFYANREGKDG